MKRFGRYDLVERIGQGGMAEVWKARLLGAEGFARTFAVKRIIGERETDPSVSAMFLREARVMARLRHRAVVQVFELDEVEGRPYLAMELIDGVTLFELIRNLPKDRYLDAGLCALMVQEVCYALGYLHSVSDDDGRPLAIVHRDVSPQNIMISIEGAVKLLDFGIAKPNQPREALTVNGVVRGKMGYMSWEHIEGVNVDYRVDIFSAGVVLWELLTARRLYKDRSDFNALREQRAERILAPSEMRTGVSPELDAICLRALSFDRQDRYSDANEMAEALGKVARSLGARTEALAVLVRAQPRKASVPVLYADSGEAGEHTMLTRRSWFLPIWAAAGVATLIAGVFVGRIVRHHAARSVAPVASTVVPSVVVPAPVPPENVAPAPSGAENIAPQEPPPPPRQQHKRKPKRPPARHSLSNIEKGQIVDPFHVRSK